MVAGFVDDDDLRFRGLLPVIAFGDHTRIFKYVNFPFVAGADGTRIIVPRLDRLDVSFFYYALCNLSLENLGYSRHFKLLKEQAIQYPQSVQEQRKIAAILSSLDDAIEKTQAVIDQVHVVKRGLMQELLTRGLPGRHTRFKETEIGEIPEGWVVNGIGELGQEGRPAVKAGPFGSSLKKSYYVSRGYRVYGQEQVLAGDLSVGDYYIDEERFGMLRSCEVKAGDVLMSLVGTFGEAIVVPVAAEPGIINPRLLRLSLDPRRIIPEFFCYWLQSAGTQKLLADAAQGGTMGVLNAGIVKSLRLGRPPLVEQSGIVAGLRTIDERLYKEIAMRTAAERARSAFMSVLLAGELRVSPDDGSP